MQGEYVIADVDKGASPNGQLDSFYVQGSWCLTDENRRYSRRSGSIARFKPQQNFAGIKNGLKGVAPVNFN